MDDHVAVIHHDPAVAGVPLLFGFLLEFFTDVVDGAVGERVEHTVAGSGADHKIIGKGCDPFQVEQENVFPFFIFQGVYDFTGKFECIQISPQVYFLINGAENNFV